MFILDALLYITSIERTFIQFILAQTYVSLMSMSFAQNYSYYYYIGFVRTPDVHSPIITITYTRVAAHIIPCTFLKTNI